MFSKHPGALFKMTVLVISTERLYLRYAGIESRIGNNLILNTNSDCHNRFRFKVSFSSKTYIALTLASLRQVLMDLDNLLEKSVKIGKDRK